MQLSTLLNRFNEPETLKMAKLGREMRAKGIDVIDLSLGEPDFDTPGHIKEAAIKAINDNWSHYTPVSGFMDLREAVCHKFKRDNNLDYKPENIVVSTGAKQSIANAMLAIVDEGDEVIIPTPYWVTYSEIVRIARGEVKFVKTSVENDYKITPAELEKAITPKTRAFIFSSPCNPTGSVYSKEELKALKDVFVKHPNVVVLSDEIYEYINYSGKHESIAQFDDIKEQVVVINGLSKGFAMTGWRIGYIAANSVIAKACEKLQGQFTSGTNSIAQKAAVVALTADLKPTRDMLDAFKERRELVTKIMNDIPGFVCNNPQGAFYVFPRIDSYFGKVYKDTTIRTAEDMAMFLLNEAHVSSVTGQAFGEDTCIRFSFANNVKNLEEGFRRIKKALALLESPVYAQ